MIPADAAEAADAVPGWMTGAELTVLAEWASECRRIVEVGCYQGRSTTAMALAMPAGGLLYAVDDWRGEVDRPGVVCRTLRDLFLTNCGRLIEAGSVLTVNVRSVCAARALAAAGIHPVDMVHIDASHDYESVRADLAAWLPLVRPGGRLVGHDIDQEPVRRAVDDVLGAGNWRRAADALWCYDVPKEATNGRETDAQAEARQHDDGRLLPQADAHAQAEVITR